MATGLALALLAAVGFGLAGVFEGAAAQTADGSPRFVAVLGQWRFLLGLALDGVGFVAQMLALRRLPLFVVQPATAASLAVTAVVAARFLGARLRGRDVVAVGAVCLGLALTAAGAAPGQDDTAPPGVRVGLVVALGVLVTIGVLATRRMHGGRSAVSSLVAGLLFGLLAMGNRVVDWFDPATALVDPAAWVVVVSAPVALWLYTSAMRDGRITSATALMVLGETVPPTLAGVLFFGDRPVPGMMPLAVAGVTLAVLGSLRLARFGEVESGADVSRPDRASGVNGEGLLHRLPRPERQGEQDAGLRTVQ